MPSIMRALTSLILLVVALAVPRSSAQDSYSMPPANSSKNVPMQLGTIGPTNVMLFLNGFHFISGQPDAYIHANHHCSIMNADFIQCAIYVPGTNPARLAGIEYIVSGALFSTFPHEERQLWHSHQFEVTSGYLTEPGTPEIVDHEIMKILVNSYGKTVHTWRYDQKDNDVPLGIPEFVNGYTGDGQLPQWFVDDRDELMNVNTTATRIAREDIEPPPVQEGADSWKYGYVITYGIVNTTTDTTFDGVD